MSWSHQRSVARRATTTSWLVLGVLGVIGGGYFRLQVLGDDRYEFQSQQNRLRPVTLPAPRGLMVDRQGEILADNIPSYTISLFAPTASALNQALQIIAPLAALDDEARAEIATRHGRAPSHPVVIMRDAPFAVVAALEERRIAIPGLLVQTEPKRRYPHGDLLAHVTGYVNEITEDELANRVVAGARYGTLIGREGLERFYDGLLRGSDGQRSIEVDALGRAVNLEPSVDGLEPQPGDTLHTTLDLELQRFVRDVFPKGRTGAVVAMDPRNGDVLAMVSVPSFDPNAFIGGIDRVQWNEWLNSPDRPLFNRAIQGIYPPASPWKLAVAAMAMKRGLVTPNTRMPEPCTGGYTFGDRYFRCWQRAGHGSLTLSEAIAHSCDVYFYQLGQRLGLDSLLAHSMEMGFAQRTGIDLPGEARPVFPETRGYFDRLYGPRGWSGGVILNLSIGQGENTQTVINMVRFYSMLANADGRSPQPRLVVTEEDPNDGDLTLGISASAISDLRRALELVVDQGTARRSRINDLRIAGKTGTGQNPHGPDHGWFVGFAPAEAPEIVVGAIVEFGEHGSDVAPFVTRIIARHLLGVEAASDREFRFTIPADSAPAPIPAVPPRGGGQ